MEPFVVVYTTLPRLEDARIFANDVVQDGGAACVNILHPIESIYMDHGVVHMGGEVAIIIKTTTENRDAVVSFVSSRHPYRVPAILTWEGSCSADFARWMRESTCHPA